MTACSAQALLEVPDLSHAQLNTTAHVHVPMLSSTHGRTHGRTDAQMHGRTYPGTLDLESNHH